jgi:hypothetical protein
MRRIFVAAALVPAAFMVVLGSAAAAHAAPSAPTTTAPDIGQAQVDKCIGTEPIVGEPPTCTYDAHGNLISRSQPGAPDTGGSTSSFVPLLLLVLIWSAVPFAIAASLARSRDEPVGTAVLLTLVLGWIGLLIVVYGQRRAVDDVDRIVHRAGGGCAFDASLSSPSERLRMIDDLHAQGLITDEERTTRRSAVLDHL